jgi:threonine dehydrogenase-like Zn-dependent dehydrogenase
MVALTQGMNLGCGGGLSDFIVVPSGSAIPLPAEVSMEVGALVEPLAVAWHAVKISPFRPGDSVLVVGGGPIGLAVIQTLRAKGAGKIIAAEVSPRRKEFATQFGADHVLDPTKTDIVESVKKLCDGQGVHVAFDAAGVQTGLNSAILALRARGTLVNIAVWEKTATVVPNDLAFKERKYMGIATYVAGDFEEVLDAICTGELPFPSTLQGYQILTAA